MNVMATSTASVASTATAVVKIPKVPPSNFASLLRRSKFASYDPQIGQVYATYDGSAHRGDWGLKRPLSIRRRDGRIIVSKIDTLYQQTDWTSAYSDSMAVRKFEELRFTPQMSTVWAARFKPDNAGNNDGNSTVQQRKWMHDSDYARPRSNDVDSDLEVNAPFPDPTTMGPRRFERYLRRLRRLRPEFEQYLEDKRQIRERNANAAVTFAQMAGDRYHEGFLAEKFGKDCKNDANFIYPMPHPTGGLTYNNMNELQSAIQAKPVRGLRTDFSRKRDQGSSPNRGTMKVVLGGWVAEEPIHVPRNEKSEYSKESPVPLVDIGKKDGEPRKERDAGMELFRPLQVKSILLKPPNVVGRYPERLGQAGMRITVVSWSGAEKARSNPHKPGTQDYIAHDESKSTANASATPVSYSDSKQKRNRLAKSTYSHKPQEPIRRPVDQSTTTAMLANLRTRLASLRGNTPLERGGKKD